MRVLAWVFALGMIAPAVGADELVMKSGQNEIRIRTDACKSEKVLDKVKNDYHKDFRSALVKWEGKDYAACWMVLPSGEVLILDETGDYGTIPQSLFRPVAWI